MLVFALLIALPALAAASRRRAMQEESEIAGALSAWAADVRGRSAHAPLEDPLRSRVQHLRAPEFATLALAMELPNAKPHLLADTAQRLALRLRRRVAFERKMLARTASGRRRAAVAASIPPLLLLAMSAGGLRIPLLALIAVVCLEACGSWLLWRIARVEI
jgi:hypothetical protein